MKNFFRKVAFGIGPNEQAPSDPLKWALDQLNDVPELSWKGKIYSEKELRKHYRDWVYGDRKVLRKKYKDNKTLYKTHKDILRHKTGQKFWESLEISIRHNEGINSNHPVLAKLDAVVIKANDGTITSSSDLRSIANAHISKAEYNVIKSCLYNEASSSFELTYDIIFGYALKPAKTLDKSGKLIKIKEIKK